MKRNQVRIIGGKWRSRLIHFPNAANLRPTPDRIRETLFNWLAPYISGARCLDLFAGSGALGFEALSRDAHFATLVESNPLVIQTLKDTQQRLATEQCEIIGQDVLTWLMEPKTSFDVVFLDPPYQSNALPICFSLLETHGWIAQHSLIYFESHTPLNPSLLPITWVLLRERKAGHVHYYLAKKMF